MPAKTVAVNLLGKSDLEHTPGGRIVAWATTYGRYIMITTEIVVLLAFISRFTLDRRLTDLQEEIAQKQSIIEANKEFEMDIRTLQDRLTKIKNLIDGQSQPINIFTLIKTYLPIDVTLQSFELNDEKLTVSAIAGTNQSFSEFLRYLKTSNQFTNILIGDIRKQAPFGIQFDFTADIVKKKS